MNRLISGLFAGALAVALTATSLVPLEAAPIMPRPATASQSGEIVQIQSSSRVIRRGNRRDARQDRRESRRETRQDRREFRQDNRQDRRNFRREARQDRGDFYGGHRGYREYRPGYRRHNGYWFPAAAFITGAIIGGAINNSAPVVRSGSRTHVQWCYGRYRSYRASDNTFQPNNGPRQQCYSPY